MAIQQNNGQEQDLNHLRKVRREKLAELQANGQNPFEITKYDVTHHLSLIHILREVYVSEQFYSRYGEELGLSAWGRQMEILSDHVFSHVSDTKTPQGILLVMEQRSCEICEMLDLDAQGRKPLLMVLDNLQDPGNLGTILRAGEAAGVTGVIMSHDCVDIYNPKVIRSTTVSYTHLDVYKRQVLSAKT